MTQSVYREMTVEFTIMDDSVCLFMDASRVYQVVYWMTQSVYQENDSRVYHIG